MAKNPVLGIYSSWLLWCNWNGEQDSREEIIKHEISQGTIQLGNIQRYESNVLLWKKHRIEIPKMTDKDELFKGFFNSEAVFVSNLTDDGLAEHIIKLEQIAFEARARLTAADDEGKKRRSKKAPKNVPSSLSGDVLASNAINQIDARNKKLSKEDKLIASLVALGMSEADARQKLGQGKTLSKLRSLGDNRPASEIKIEVQQPLLEPNKPFVNPFAKE